MRYSLSLLGLVLLPWTSGCASWPWGRMPPAPMPPPPAFAAMPTLDELVRVVNDRSSRVHQLQAENVALKVEGVPALPALRASLAFERPRNFRLRAELFQLTGRELDLGSNQDVFWMWIKRSPQPAVHYARHENQIDGAASQLLPMRPEQLSESFGLVWLDPATAHQGPSLNAAGNLVLSSPVETPQGRLTRQLIVHPRYAWILEHQWVDSSGRLLARSQMDQYRYYPLEQVSLPHRIHYQWVPPGQTPIGFELNVGQYLVNQLYGDPGQLWSMPQIEGSPPVNLADLAEAPRREIPSAESTSRVARQIDPLAGYRGYTR